MSEIVELVAEGEGVLSYRPGGASLERFHQSTKFVRLIAGPIGSGKTTACCTEALFTAMLQKPGSDGVRRAAVGILRDTYRNLYGTTLRTWFKTIPRECGKFTGSDDRPFVHLLKFPAPFIDRFGMPTDEYGPVHLEVQGRALGANSVEATARGWELTAAFIDEIDLTPPESVSFLKGRVQRFPAANLIVSRGVWGAFNKPDVDHWLYQMCVEDKPRDVEFFDQPGGLIDGPPPYQTNPEAENLQNLPAGYYETSAEGEKEDQVRRMLKNQWGASSSGTVIYPMFRDRGDLAHIKSVEIEPATGEDLWIGIDGGGTPAAVIGGRKTNGRIMVYAELVVLDESDPKGRTLQQGVGPTGFAERLRDLILARFPRHTFVMGYCDPAGFYGADRERGEYAWAETVQNVLNAAGIKISIQPAPTNEIAVRLDAVKSQLLRLNDTDSLPQLIINKFCLWLRRGFVADYHYTRYDAKQPGKTLDPHKSKTSHVHDALQYLVLGMIGRAGVTAGKKFDRYQPPKPPQSYQSDVIVTASTPHQLQQRRDNPEGRLSYSQDFDLWSS